MTGMNWQPSKQPKPSTYAERARNCEACGKEFKVHRYNRHRRTCSKACSTVLRSTLQKAAIAADPTIITRMGGHGNRTTGYDAQFGDPRDQKKLLEDLVTLNARPCTRCGDTKFYHLTDRESTGAYGVDYSKIYVCINQYCRRQKSIMTGTLFAKNRTSLPVWLECIRQVASGNTNSTILAYHLGVAQKTAHSMIKKIRPLAYPTNPYVQWAKYPDRPLERGALASHSSQD